VHSNGSIHGVEALIRWNSSQHGFVSPAEFIPIAEESGLILEIGKWVLESACQQLKRWENDPMAHHLILAINISPNQFAREDFVDQITQAIDHHNINPDKLKLEITEGILVKDMRSAIEKMQLLKQKGLRISLDDFGTGYSSLTYLKHLPLNQLKIDRSFVMHVDADPADQAIAKTIVTLGETLGLNVIAEGVETKAQLETLVACGCHLFQGYYFSKPLLIEDFEQYLQQQS
jgi:EAL domain-containing protein (putative c-di-GMP-specific phosphodiesterase class I)